MKKVVVTITAVVFALGLAGAGLAQTVTTTEKPAVKTEAPAVPATVAPKEAAKPAEKPAVKETAKPGEKAKEGAQKEVKAAEKGKTKKEAKKGKEAKKPVVVEPLKQEKK